MNFQLFHMSCVEASQDLSVLFLTCLPFFILLSHRYLNLVYSYQCMVMISPCIEIK